MGIVNAWSSIHQVLKKINQLVLTEQPIVLARLVKEYKASGTLATLLKRHQILTPVEGKVKIFTWTLHKGKVQDLGDYEISKLAAMLSDETRQLKTQSRLKVKKERAQKEKLTTLYRPLQSRQTTKIGNRPQTLQPNKKVADQTISLDALLYLSTFTFDNPTSVHLFGQEFPNTVSVKVSTCDFAETLYFELTHKCKAGELTNQKVSTRVVGEFIMVDGVGFGLRSIT